jgi:hypothetical protein
VISHSSIKIKPQVKKGTKPQAKVSVTHGISLSDQISQLLPGGAILTTPSAFPLVREPVTIWSNSPPTFSALTQVLGVPVQLFLTPTFHWNFGDSEQISTANPGAPYPNGNITHTYLHAGNYLITMEVSWTGNWIADHVTSLITGGLLTQSYQYPISVITAPTRFIG